MTLEEALKLVNPGDPFLHNMVIALQLCPWMNTAEETRRLEAAKLVLKNKNKIRFAGRGKYEVVK